MIATEALAEAAAHSSWTLAGHLPYPLLEE